MIYLRMGKQPYAHEFDEGKGELGHIYIRSVFLCYTRQRIEAIGGKRERSSDSEVVHTAV